MTVVMVAPLGPLSSASTRACFEFVRAWRWPEIRPRAVFARTLEGTAATSSKDPPRAAAAPGARARRRRMRHHRNDGDQAPAFVCLTLDIGLTGLALGIERVEGKLKIVLGRLARIAVAPSLRRDGRQRMFSAAAAEPFHPVRIEGGCEDGERTLAPSVPKKVPRVLGAPSSAQVSVVWATQRVTRLIGPR